MHPLLIAYYLSILTFYLGVLIYALPIPLTGLKKWGPRLITDAFFIAILTLSLNTIVGVADYIRVLAGGNWESFLLHVKSTIMFRTMIILLLSTLSIFFSKFLPGINKLINLVTNPILASLYANMLLYSIATVVHKGVWLLSSLGILLMAIPFRIARNAGAFLLSFALIFYIALPLYPSFYRILLYSPSAPLEMPLIYGSIVNEFGYKIDDGYMGFEVASNNYIGPIPLYSNNYILFITSSKLISSPITAYLDVTGHQFYTNLSNVNLYDICLQNVKREFYLSVCRIDILVKGLIAYSNGVSLHIFPKVENVSVDIFNSEYIKVIIDSQIDSNLYISLVDAYSVNEITVDGSSISLNELTSYRWYWYDLMGNTYIINIPQGIHIIEIRMKLNNMLSTEPSEMYSYIAIQQMFPATDTLFTDVLNEITRVIYVDLIASIMFLSLLTSISWGLARIIGGSSKIRVFL